MKKLLLLMLVFMGCSQAMPQKYDVVCTTPDGFVLSLDGVALKTTFGGLAIPLPDGSLLETGKSRCMWRKSK